MIEVYTKAVTVLSDSALPLSNVSLDKGCDCKLVGASTINLTRRGVYRIAVSVDAIANNGGDITFQLYRDGLAQAGTVASETAGDTTSKHSLSFTALVNGVESVSSANSCCKNPISIQIMNAGVAVTLTNLNVTITREHIC